jgi:alanine-synthesizing transaminase
VSLAPVGGGWSAVLRVPSVLGEEELCLRCLERRGIAIHPGSLFGFTDRGRLVVSLLPRPELFSGGSRGLLEEIERTIA